MNNAHTTRPLNGEPLSTNLPNAISIQKYKAVAITLYLNSEPSTRYRLVSLFMNASACVLPLKSFVQAL